MIAGSIRTFAHATTAAAFVSIVTTGSVDASGANGKVSPKHPTAQGTIVHPEAAPASALQSSREAYDRAFLARDIPALSRILAEDVVLYEQGGQNIGREDVLTNHLEPELRSFQELSANYSDVSVREAGDMALVTRLFSIKGKRQGRPFSIRGSETQGWILRQGRWELMHIHLSFPSN